MFINQKLTGFWSEFVNKVPEGKKHSRLLSIEMNNQKWVNKRCSLFILLKCFTSLPSPLKSISFCNMDLLWYLFLHQAALIHLASRLSCNLPPNLYPHPHFNTTRHLPNVCIILNISPCLFFWTVSPLILGIILYSCNLIDCMTHCAY